MKSHTVLLRAVELAAGPGAAAIVRERIRQREEEGWTDDHDDEHAAGEMAIAAACYAVQEDEHPPSRLTGVFERIDRPHGGVDFRDAWPWEQRWDGRRSKPRDRRLTIAGALLAAELDREARARERRTGPSE